MLIKKKIEVTVSILNAHEYAADPDGALNVARELYRGKCYAGCLILDVLEVLEEGECVPNYYSQECESSVHLSLLISAIVYPPGEIINKCLIVKKDESQASFLCRSEYADIFVQDSSTVGMSMVASLLPGQYVSIIVVDAATSISDERVSIIGNLYKIDHMPKLYKIPAFNPKPELYEDMLSNINFEEEIKQNINTTLWSTFDTLFTPDSKPPQLANGKLIDIMSLVSGGSTTECYLYVHPSVNPASHMVWKCTTVPPGPYMEIPGLDPDATVLSLLQNYYNRLIMLREMSELYIGDLIVSHTNLWKIYKKQKTQ